MRQEIPEGAAAPAGGPGQDPSSSQLKVIAVVDDDAAVCDSTRILLEAFGFEVLTYQNPADFLIDSPRIACLIVDYHMPALNGFDLTAEFKKHAATTPVIMITAMADPLIEKRAMELGINRVLRKPLGKLLIEAIGEQIE